MASGGWARRALPWLKDEGFGARLGDGLRGYAAQVNAEAAHDPFGVPFSDETWRKKCPGVGGELDVPGAGGGSVIRRRDGEKLNTTLIEPGKHL